MIESYIATKLDSDSTLAAIRGRVFALVAEQDTDVPFVVYERTSMDPPGIPFKGFDKVRVRVTAWHTTYADAHALGNLIRDVLHGNTGSDTNVKVRLIQLANMADTYAILEGSETLLYGMHVDFDCDYENL